MGQSGKAATFFVGDNGQGDVKAAMGMDGLTSRQYRIIFTLPGVVLGRIPIRILVEYVLRCTECF